MLKKKQFLFKGSNIFAHYRCEVKVAKSYRSFYITINMKGEKRTVILDTSSLAKVNALLNTYGFPVLTERMIQI